MSASSGVPGSQGLLEQARSFRTIGGFLAAIGGTIALAFTFLVSEPVAGLARGFGEGAFNFAVEAMGFIIAPLTGGSDIILAGAQETIRSISGQGIAGFGIGIGIAVFAIGLAMFLFDLFDFDIPFLGDVPFVGPEDDDEE